MKNFKTFFIEKTVLGLEELIDLKGLGKFKAKLDSGNGAYNVLHGENIKADNNMVRFTTANGFELEKPLKETIDINIGAGNIESRPVVLFDVMIGNKSFNDVPFSIGNRANNIHKVLIGKSFIENELDALIDVGLINVADKNLEVKVI